MANIKDSAAIANLVNSAYRGETSKKGWTTEADLLDGQRTDVLAIDEMLGEKTSEIIVFEDTQNLNIVACVYLKKESEWAYLGMLTVSPVLQQERLGRRLLEACEKFVLSEWKLSQIKMTVITLRSELIDWYQRRGYQRTGIYSSFPHSNPRFGLPKRPDLQFETLLKILS